MANEPLGIVDEGRMRRVRYRLPPRRVMPPSTKNALYRLTKAIVEDRLPVTVNMEMPKSLKAPPRIFMGEEDNPTRRRKPINIKLCRAIIQAACTVFDVEYGDIVSVVRTQKMAFPRFAVMKLIYERDAGTSVAQIGRLLHKDHTSILSGLHRANDLYASNPSWRANFDKVKAILDEAGSPS